MTTKTYQVIKSEMSGWYYFKRGMGSLCPTQVERLFDTGNAIKLTFEVTDRKPRDNDYHVLERDVSGNWSIVDLVDYPVYIPPASQRLNRAFKGKKRLYVSCY